MKLVNAGQNIRKTTQHNRARVKVLLCINVYTKHHTRRRLYAFHFLPFFHVEVLSTGFEGTVMMYTNRGLPILWGIPGK